MKVRDSLILTAAIGGLVILGIAMVWRAAGRIEWAAVGPMPERLPMLPGPPKRFDPAALRKQKEYHPVSIRPSSSKKAPPKTLPRKPPKEAASARPAPKEPWRPKARLRAVPGFEERIEPRSEPQATGASMPVDEAPAARPRAEAPAPQVEEEPEAPTPRPRREPEEAPQAGEYEASGE